MLPELKFVMSYCSIDDLLYQYEKEILSDFGYTVSKSSSDSYTEDGSNGPYLALYCCNSRRSAARPSMTSAIGARNWSRSEIAI